MLITLSPKSQEVVHRSRKQRQSKMHHKREMILSQQCHLYHLQINLRRKTSTTAGDDEDDDSEKNQKLDDDKEESLNL